MNLLWSGSIDRQSYSTSISEIHVPKQNCVPEKFSEWLDDWEKKGVICNISENPPISLQCNKTIGVYSALTSHEFYSFFLSRSPHKFVYGKLSIETNYHYLTTSCQAKAYN